MDLPFSCATFMVMTLNNTSDLKLRAAHAVLDATHYYGANEGVGDSFQTTGLSSDEGSHVYGVRWIGDQATVTVDGSDLRTFTLTRTLGIFSQTDPETTLHAPRPRA